MYTVVLVHNCPRTQLSLYTIVHVHNSPVHNCPVHNCPCTQLSCTQLSMYTIVRTQLSCTQLSGTQLSWNRYFTNKLWGNTCEKSITFLDVLLYSFLTQINVILMSPFLARLTPVSTLLKSFWPLSTFTISILSTETSSQKIF